jgi:hypothetical protein
MSARRQSGSRGRDRRCGEQPRGVEELGGQRRVGRRVRALGALRQADCGPREGELGYVDGEARPRGVVQDGPVPRGGMRRQHDGDARARSIAGMMWPCARNGTRTKWSDAAMALTRYC